jgi:hypothetical protein
MERNVFRWLYLIRGHGTSPSIVDLPFFPGHGDLLNSLSINWSNHNNIPGQVVFQHLPPVLILTGKTLEHDLTTSTMQTVNLSIRPTVYFAAKMARSGTVAHAVPHPCSRRSQIWTIWSDRIPLMIYVGKRLSKHMLPVSGLQLSSHKL